MPAEVIQTFPDAVAGEDGRQWTARACARPTERNWEAWIEFIPLEKGTLPVRTPVETSQPDREAVSYWASGLTPLYLMGALERALDRPEKIVSEDPLPVFDTPAPAVRERRI